MNNERWIKGVALDMDGLLLNTEDLYEIVCDELMHRRGKTYRDEVRQAMMGLPAPQAFAVLINAENLSEDWESLQRESDSIFESLLETRLEPMPGVSELLATLDNLKLPRCVATSSRRKFAEEALTKVGLIHQIDFIITAEDVANGKPHPDIYLAAAKKMNTEVRRMLVLEDSEIGTAAGVAAGTHIISVPNRHTSKSTFIGAKAIVKDGLHSNEIYDALSLMI